MSAATAAPNQQQPISRRAANRPKGKKRIYLSHSSREKFSTCGRAYRYSHVDRLDTEMCSANLGFGKAVHRAVEVYLISSSLGQNGLDPVSEFNRVWDDFCLKHTVEYTSRWDQEKFRETGHILISKFIEDWTEKGFIVVLDVNGEPVIERKLRVELPGNVVFTAILDILAMDPSTGRIYVIDVKTPGQKGFEGFTEMSEQLLGQQVVVDAHKDVLGVDQVDGRLFYDLYKVPPPKTNRGEGPHVLPLQIAGRADDAAISDWINETVAIAEDIRNQRFPRRPGDSYNSPCKLCDFFSYCRTGSMVGIKRKNPLDVNAAIPDINPPNGTIPF